MNEDFQLYIPVKNVSEMPLHNFEVVDKAHLESNEQLVPFTQELIEKIASKFTNFELNTLEINVNCESSTGNVLNWIVNVKGSGGIKLVFTRKE